MAQSRPAEGDAAFPAWRRSVLLIAVSAGMASFAMNFWVPFLPLYMQDLGAGSEANALFWVALAMSGTGIGRILTGPLWGALADRYGRKRMYVRALIAATLTTLIAVVAQEPWHVTVAWTCQGALSGFIPAAIALTSVSVPGTRLSSGLGTVQAGQYTGTTIGPALGGLIAYFFGLRGAILTGALLPLFAGLLVLVFVPRDSVAPRPAPLPKAERPRWTATLTRDLSVQFGIGLLVYFAIFVMQGMVRNAAPVAIGDILGYKAPTDITGYAFGVAGVGSVIGALVLARWLTRPGNVRVSLALITAVTALAHVLLGLAGSVWLFTVWFTVISLAQGAMLPATNTIIAAAVPAERRGTAFGIASSAQALAFIVGPMAAALFAALSLPLGFTVLGVGLGLTALAVFTGLREPDLGRGTVATGRTPAAGAPERGPEARSAG